MPGQQAAKVRRIGFLAVGSREGRAFLIEGLLQGLREHGYVEGQNIVIEYRFSEGRNDRLPDLAAELVARKVELILASGSPASFAAKQATSTIPIVMGSLNADPVETGLIASLARPGGNITGLSALAPELSGKRLELLKEVVPGMTRVAVLWNAANPANASAWQETQAAARTLGVTVQSLGVQDLNDLDGAFATLTETRPDALLVLGDSLINMRRQHIVEFATQQHLPSVFFGRESVVAGGLMSYGPSIPDLYRRAATYVDKLLKGTKPADLPVEQPTKFELVINLQTAKALGITMPPSLLLLADEVIK
jgi:putative tryptophan/tyrosine transport system substrate-binding protein